MSTHNTFRSRCQSNSHILVCHKIRLDLLDYTSLFLLSFVMLLDIKCSMFDWFIPLIALLIFLTCFVRGVSLTDFDGRFSLKFFVFATRTTPLPFGESFTVRAFRWDKPENFFTWMFFGLNGSVENHLGTWFFFTMWHECTRMICQQRSGEAILRLLSLSDLKPKIVPKRLIINNS